MEPTSGDTSSGAYTLIQDGNPVASGQFLDGVVIPVSAQPATYTRTYDVTRSAPWWTFSTSTHTEWTFHSARSIASRPAGRFCDVHAATDCDFLPMIFADYDLPADASGHEPAGATTATLRPFYRQPSGPPRVRTVALDVSFDGGTSWTPATVTAWRGAYQATYTNPATGDVTLWLTVSDSAGDEFVQVIQRAYAVD